MTQPTPPSNPSAPAPLPTRVPGESRPPTQPPGPLAENGSHLQVIRGGRAR
ncbi:hypothetical protein [Streptomyces javensis]|uniref:Uncharacterized protein n=1 Tax=Streptomyces javensis TaxID=114698 RepID=A0ABS0R6K9_9ACTN|nr:hypothetical protein [Streptomyces javensis]MBI0312728.1 hypothetical protein [Streptomyces javensis]